MRNGKKRAVRKRLDLPNKAFRTRLANGTAILEGVDGRSHIARRYREIGAALATDLGGADYLSEAQQQLIRSAAGLVVLRERLDVMAVNGKIINHAEYCAVSNTLRRVLRTLGIERTPRDVTSFDVNEQTLNRLIDQVRRERPTNGVAQ